MKNILIQLDTDDQPSSFDAITALDGGADYLLRYNNVSPSNVVSTIHGAIFTRSPKQLHQTAIFIGGNDVTAGEEVLKRVRETFFGPMRVSVMMDSNGCNTTAVAAILAAGRHTDLTKARTVVFGGTGPVGRRVAMLLASLGGRVHLVSRSIEKAEQVVSTIDGDVGELIPEALPPEGQRTDLLQNADMVVCAGAAGTEFLSLEELQKCPDLKVAIDLNAVPPLGIQGIESGDKAREAGPLICYGALAVGGLKMKLHHHIISELFQSNDRIFDTFEIYETGVKMG